MIDGASVVRASQSTLAAAYFAASLQHGFLRSHLVLFCHGHVVPSHECPYHFVLHDARAVFRLPAGAYVVLFMASAMLACHRELPSGGTQVQLSLKAGAYQGLHKAGALQRLYKAGALQSLHGAGVPWCLRETGGLLEPSHGPYSLSAYARPVLPWALP